MRREMLKNITRIVLKLGTGVLTDSRKQPDLAQMEQLVAQIAEQRKAGREMVLVASSRSARTALPKEQNQPGRRLEQAAQPAGTCRVTCLCRVCVSAVI